MDKFQEKHGSYVVSSMNFLNELANKFDEEYEVTKNYLAQTYSFEIREFLTELEKVLAGSDSFSTDDEEFILKQINDVMLKYDSNYRTILGRESLKRYASDSPEEFEEMPLWENLQHEKPAEFTETKTEEKVEAEPENERSFTKD